jgi:hypothetical protein
LAAVVVAGLGDESQVGSFPDQNGNADFTLTVTATFQPASSPPMSVLCTDIVLTDLTNGINVRL